MRFLRRKVLALIGCTALAVCALASPTRAAMVTYGLTPYTGSSASVHVKFEDLPDNAMNPNDDDVRVTVTVIPNPNIGDIRGVFLNSTTDAAAFLGGLTATGANVTQLVVGQNSVTTAGGGNNTNPEGPFDIGIEIGTPGIGGDDIQVTTFVLSHSSSSLNIGMFTTATDLVSQNSPLALLMAVRLTSVGVGETRTGSSKLGADGPEDIIPTDPVNPVPEPTSLVLGAFGAASCLVAGYRRRRARATA